MGGIMVTIIRKVTPLAIQLVPPRLTPELTPGPIKIMGSEELVEKLLNTFMKKKNANLLI